MTVNYLLSPLACDLFSSYTKKSLTQLLHCCIEYRYYFCHKMLIFCKTTYGCVLTYQTLSLKHNSNEI